MISLKTRPITGRVFIVQLFFADLIFLNLIKPEPQKN